MRQLTKRQKEILDFIIAFHDRDGRFPTGPEIAENFGFKDPSPAYQHLDALETKGFIKIKRFGYGRPTAIQLSDRGHATLLPSWPLLGSISAGPLTDVVDAPEKRLSKLTDVIPQLHPNDFFLVVSGDSMIGADILPGQLVVVRPDAAPKSGDICSVWVEGEGATLKYVYPEEDSIRLVPANPRYQPHTYPADQVKIQGVVIAALAVTTF
jgi:repressor LexA